ncbi:hypothetical protein N7495_000661 [Penicillium taxi]|uniref:uncharacterized protein n=1 Tax=Penicillium taxi TaxID=168475 RepID=UPI00254539FC|nr:uncharacterized protein N7495_000661 [Penicillium taxi]KAJ5907979.1 hypothetical protein N7495_000661 [Penicillium taxi]
MAGPRIACIGVIGKAVCSSWRTGAKMYTYHAKQDNPLHISLFPPHTDATIEFSFLLNSCLDIFEIHRKQTSIDQDLGLLQAVDERLAAYGWLTTTGVKLLIIVDVFGLGNTPSKLTSFAANGLRDADLKPAFRALQTAYIQLLQNPFYSPDKHAPGPGAAVGSATSCEPISNSRFIADVKRIGETWTPGTAI